MTHLAFVSNISWPAAESSGFRTRQEVLLKTFCQADEISRLTVVVPTGFRGEVLLQPVEQTIRAGCRVFEARIPGRIVEMPLRIFYPGGLWRNYRLPTETRSLLAAEPPDLIFSYSAALGHLLRQFTGAKLIYDVVDNKLQDPNIRGLQRLIWQNELRYACRKADVISCNSDMLHQTLSAHAKRCILVRNGVDPSRFNGCEQQQNRKDVVFVGLISAWIDFDLIEQALHWNPSLQFHFYGEIITGQEKVSQLAQTCSNAHWHGPIPPSQVPAVLASARLAILPYQPKEVFHAVGDSMKLYEYLAAGTPALSSDFQPALSKKFNGLVRVTTSADEFCQAIAEMTTAAIDPDWQKRAHQFVLENSWHARVDQILTAAR